MIHRLTILLAVAVFSGRCRGQPRSGPITTREKLTVVAAQFGSVRGYIDDGVYAVRGMPYAKADRFMPAQAPGKRDSVRQCTIYGPQAIQGTAHEFQSWPNSLCPFAQLLFRN